MILISNNTQTFFWKDLKMMYSWQIYFNIIVWKEQVEIFYKIKKRCIPKMSQKFGKNIYISIFKL
jgi:hypothetical protein